MVISDPDNPRSDWLYHNPKRLNLTIMEQISRFTLYRYNGCWEFHGRTNNYGYGRIEYQGRDQQVTHIVWRIMKGKKVRKGFQLNHNCDNPRCYNPDHLYEGTQADNLSDMRERGAQTYFPRPVPVEIKSITQHMKRRFI